VAINVMMVVERVLMRSEPPTREGLSLLQVARSQTLCGTAVPVLLALFVVSWMRDKATVLQICVQS